jgi:hypothetical protein
MACPSIRPYTPTSWRCFSGQIDAVNPDLSRFQGKRRKTDPLDGASRDWLITPKQRDGLLHESRGSIRWPGKHGRVCRGTSPPRASAIALTSSATDKAPTPSTCLARCSTGSKKAVKPSSTGIVATQSNPLGGQPAKQRPLCKFPAIREVQRHGRSPMQQRASPASRLSRPSSTAPSCWQLWRLPALARPRPRCKRRPSARASATGHRKSARFGPLVETRAGRSSHGGARWQKLTAIDYWKKRFGAAGWAVLSQRQETLHCRLRTFAGGDRARLLGILQTKRSSPRRWRGAAAAAKPLGRPELQAPLSAPCRNFDGHIEPIPR